MGELAGPRQQGRRNLSGGADKSKQRTSENRTLARRRPGRGMNRGAHRSDRRAVHASLAPRCDPGGGARAHPTSPLNNARASGPGPQENYTPAVAPLFALAAPGPAPAAFASATRAFAAAVCASSMPSMTNLRMDLAATGTPIANLPMTRVATMSWRKPASPLNCTLKSRLTTSRTRARVVDEDLVGLERGHGHEVEPAGADQTVGVEGTVLVVDPSRLGGMGGGAQGDRRGHATLVAELADCLPDGRPQRARADLGCEGPHAGRAVLVVDAASDDAVVELGPEALGHHRAECDADIEGGVVEHLVGDVEHAAELLCRDGVAARVERHLLERLALSGPPASGRACSRPRHAARAGRERVERAGEGCASENAIDDFELHLRRRDDAVEVLGSEWWHGRHLLVEGTSSPPPAPSSRLAGLPTRGAAGSRIIARQGAHRHGRRGTRASPQRRRYSGGAPVNHEYETHGVPSGQQCSSSKRRASSGISAAK